VDGAVRLALLGAVPEEEVTTQGEKIVENQKKWLAIFVIPMAAGLTACGSGDSDNDNDLTSSTANNELNYDTNNYATTAAVVTGEESLQISTEAFAESQNFIQLFSAIQSALNGTEQTLPLLVDGQNDGSSTDSAPANIAVGHLVCSEENGTLQETYRDSDNSMFREIRFENCQVPNLEPAIVLDGTLSLKAEDWGSSTNGGIELVNSFNLHGSVGAQLEPLVLEGKQILRFEVAEAKSSVTLETPVMEFRLGDSYTALQNAKFATTQSDTVDTVSIDAKFISSALGGYIEITTPVTFESTDNLNCPQKGRMRVAGSGSVEVAYGESVSQPGKAVEVIIDGSETRFYDTCSGFTSSPALSGPVGPVL